MTSRICTACGAEKLLSEFYAHGKYQDGTPKLMAICKKCHVAKKAERRRSNTELRQREYRTVQKWVEKNPGKRAEYSRESRRRRGILPKKEWPVARPGFFVCRRCEIEKPVSEFPKQSTKQRGHGPYCKSCTKEIGKGYYQRKTKPQPPTAGDEHYCRHCDTVKHESEFSEGWKPSWLCKSCKSEKAREYRKANPDKIRHAEKIRDYRLRGAPGGHTDKEWEKLKRKYKYTCLRCNRQEPEIRLTEDHVIPIVLGGDNNITNIQPLCFSCNSSKGAMTIDYRQAVTISFHVE